MVVCFHIWNVVYVHRGRTTAANYMKTDFGISQCLEISCKRVRRRANLIPQNYMALGDLYYGLFKILETKLF